VGAPNETVAAIPPPPAMSFRAAWNSAATSSETGSSRMSANAAVVGSVGRASGDEPHPAISIAIATVIAIPARYERLRLIPVIGILGWQGTWPPNGLTDG
jgi:hypothetical protein